MESVLSFKMLAVFALVLLVSSVNEGRVLTKCELKAQLDAAFGASLTGNMTGSLPGNTTGNLIAKIVCTVNRTSRFNTSLITTIQKSPPHQDPPKPISSHSEKPDQKPPKGGKEQSNQKPQKPDGKPRGKRSPPRVPGSISGGSSANNTNLLGIFQLSDCVACYSGSNQSQNLCGLNCSALIDDDITDDIACLKTLMESTNNTTNTPSISSSQHRGKENKKEKKELKEVLCVEECRSVGSSQYFSECV